jgi:hypothetical protein
MIGAIIKVSCEGNLLALPRHYLQAIAKGDNPEPLCIAKLLTLTHKKRRFKAIWKELHQTPRTYDCKRYNNIFCLTRIRDVMAEC